MTDRYWTASDAPDSLLDWVNENVNEAIKHCWEEDKPVAWIDVEENRMVLTVAGPGKPTEDDPGGNSDVYTVKFDILKELVEFSSPYAEIGGPCSEVQRNDMQERVVELRKLADGINKLAADAEKTIGI